jgi:gamma-glutamylputrescine oxidase
MQDQPSTERAPTWPQPATESWWQQQWPSPGYAPLSTNARVDLVVIGGGVSGCAAAWAAAQRGLRVALLEARDVASGASGRNGGFLLAGLAHRPVPLAGIVGTDRAAQLHAYTTEARDRLFDAAQSIGAEDLIARTGSLRLAVDPAELDELHQEAQLLEDAGMLRLLRLDAHELPERLVGSFLGGLHFPDDGRSVPAGWVRALGAAAVDAGAVIHEHSPVEAIEDDGDGVTVRTTDGCEVRADHAIVATEAWLSGLLPELAGVVLPYRSQVLAAAAPRGDDGQARTVLRHVTWSRRGWDYAQQAADGTLVVGGERVEDVNLHRRWEESIVDDDQQWLESWIQRVLGVEPVVRMRWAGVLSQTPDGFPLIGALPGRPRVLCCGGWGGAGNVLGFAGGQLAVDAALDGGDAIPQEFRAARLASRVAARGNS